MTLVMRTCACCLADTHNEEFFASFSPSIRVFLCKECDKESRKQRRMNAWSQLGHYDDKDHHGLTK